MKGLKAFSAAAAAAGLLAVPMAAQAIHLPYRVDLQELNDSGVTGTANLEFRTSDGDRVNPDAGEDVSDITSLFVQINTTGVAPDHPHPQHIHGFVPSDENGVVPPEDADDNGSGDDDVLSFAEALPFYGPVILPLQEQTGTAPAQVFPVPDDSSISYTANITESDLQSFSQSGEDRLGDPGAKVIDSFEDLLPLENRVIVQHGGFVDGEYRPTLSVTAGQIRAVPTPSAAAGGLALLGLAALRRRRRYAS